MTGDSLGPVIGYKLNKLCGREVTIIGSLEHPVHAVNLIQTLHWISLRKDKPILVAIDASIGMTEHVGYITLSNRPLKPGQAVDKDLQPLDIFPLPELSAAGRIHPFFLYTIPACPLL